MMTELDHDQQRLVEQVMSGTDQLLAACNRLMLLMRAFADDPVPSPQPFDLAGLLGDVQAIASPATPIRVAVDGDVPGTLVGDAESIRQVLTELVANALIHGRQPVGIRVETAGPGADQRLPLRFTVTDGGPGLPAEQVARLTGADETVPDDARQLGLYLAARLAHRLGGRLAVEPPAAVSLVVTLRRPASAPLRGGTSATGPSLQILLVEDNSINRLLTERQMARLGHRLDTVTNGRDGVTRALAGEYDVVLMDRHLPDLDGVEATQRIRAAEAAKPGRRRVAGRQPDHRRDGCRAGVRDAARRGVRGLRLGRQSRERPGRPRGAARDQPPHHRGTDRGAGHARWRHGCHGNNVHVRYRAWPSRAVPSRATTSPPAICSGG